jgi:hypothetical protein
VVETKHTQVGAQMAMPDEIPPARAIHHLLRVYSALGAVARLRAIPDEQATARLDGLNHGIQALWRSTDGAR